MDMYTKFFIALMVSMMFVVMPLYLPIAIKKNDNTFRRAILTALCLVGVCIEWLVVFYATFVIVCSV